MRCEKCGRENSPGDVYCMGCGDPMTGSASVPPSPKKKPVPLWLIAAVLAVVAIVVAAVVLSGLGTGGDPSGGDLNVTVHNSESSTIDYSLYFEGALVKQGSLAPAENAQWSTHFGFEGSSAITHVLGSASWGSGGRSTEWHNETLNRGGTLQVNLDL